MLSNVFHMNRALDIYIYILCNCWIMRAHFSILVVSHTATVWWRILMFVCVSVKAIGMFHREKVTFLADPSDMHLYIPVPVGEDVDTSVKILGIFQYGPERNVSIGKEKKGKI